MKIRKNPIILEINTAVWLKNLSTEYKRKITLAKIPDEEINRICSLGKDAIWLMGIWQRSAISKAICEKSDFIYNDFYNLISDDLIPETDEILGSPYAIYDYQVDRSLGTENDLLEFKEKLNRRNTALILDFVPNHLAQDHHWVSKFPERFVNSEKLPADSFSGFYYNNLKFAHGKDPNYAGWTDTVQLDYTQAKTRKAMEDFLENISKYSDGVRCDMAMLVNREIFSKTWKLEFDIPFAEFWPAAISRIKAGNPDFLFISEVYWDLEWKMQQLGFDYCYDKRIYDRYLNQDFRGVTEHLKADLKYLEKLVHFTENHDEKRIASLLPVTENFNMTTMLFLLPGMKLLHEGQAYLYEKKLPVQLVPLLEEVKNENYANLFSELINYIDQDIFHQGNWQLETKLITEERIVYSWKTKEKYLYIALNFREQDRFELKEIRINSVTEITKTGIYLLKS